MNLKRTATIAIVGGALAAWLAGAATSTRTPPPIVAPAPPIDARGERLADEIARLHERLRPSAAPRQPGRNLFVFNAPAPAAPAVAPATKAAITEAVAALVPAQPMLKLAGIAEDAEPGGALLRSAIISAEGQLFIVKEGESVTERYRVTKITPDVVELMDLATNTPRRLALR